MNSLTQSRPDVYKTKAIITRKRRNEADKRLTAQFAERRQAFEAKLDAILAANAEKWKSAMLDEIDAIPDNPAEIFTPEEVGRMDAEEGRDCEPTEHYSKLGDCERYVIGYKTAKGELEMTAEWRLVPNYPNYRVSNMGHVESNFIKGSRSNTGEWKPLKAHIGKNGYPQVVISFNKKPKSVLVHTLVLEAFVGPRPEGMDACHENGIRNDNRVGNLRWDTRKNNAQDAMRHGSLPKGENHCFAKLSEQQVIEIKALLSNGQMKHKDIAAIYGVTKSAISYIGLGLRWRHLHTDAEIEQEANDYEEDMLDREFWSRGQY